MIPRLPAAFLWMATGLLFYSSTLTAVPKGGTRPHQLDSSEERRYAVPEFRHNADPADLFLSQDLEITGFEGQTLTSVDLQGRIVLFEFWWSGCEYGVGPVSYLKSLTRRLADEPFLLISVNTDGETEEMRLYLKKYGMDWPQYLYSAELRGEFDVEAYPTHILVDHEGTIVLRESGWSSLVETRLDWEIGRALRAAQHAAD